MRLRQSLKGCAIIVGVPFALIVTAIATDRIFVEIGRAWARKNCTDPGPLKIYDARAWERYSKAVRKFASSDTDEAYNARKSIRVMHGISKGLEKITPDNPFLITATYTRAFLYKNNKSKKRIAELNHYGSDGSGPIMKFILIGGATRGSWDICKNAGYYNFPEFY